VIAPGVWPHEIALAAMKRASVNVLILADGPGTRGDLSSKLFEYLAAGRPLLALVPPGGAAARLLAEYPEVPCCDPADEQAVVVGLERLYRRWLSGEPWDPPGADRLRRWTRRFQTQRLARVCDAACGGAAGPARARGRMAFESCVEC
jgi:hypothetical protein